MDKSNIMTFAGMYLRKNKVINAYSLQKYIMQHPDSESTVSMEDIAESLGLLYYANFLDIVSGSGFESVYVKDRT